MLARTFSGKYTLAQEGYNRYTALKSVASVVVVPEVTDDKVKEAFAALKVDSTAGPDLLPTRILKEAAEELLLPTKLLTQQLLATGCWPDP